MSAPRKEFEQDANKVYQTLAYCNTHTPKDGTTVFPDECDYCKEQAERIRQALLAAKRVGMAQSIKDVCHYCAGEYLDEWPLVKDSKGRYGHQAIEGHMYQRTVHECEGERIHVRLETQAPAARPRFTKENPRAHGGEG